MTRDTGLLLRGIGGFYTVRGSDGACHTLRAQAKLRRQRLHPMAGDQVVYTPGEGEQNGWLEEILPRKNQLLRPPVANIDACVLVISAGYPQADLMLIDRMLIFARMNGIEPVLAVNKCDEGDAQQLAAQYRGAQVQVFATCARTGEGVDELKEALSGKIYALCGQSGVGKSSLINRMYGLTLETGSLSEKIDRGRNTTRQCELTPLPGGGGVLDTPGFSLLELPLLEPVKLLDWMPEFEGYEGKCRFSPCLHRTEPGCAVRADVETGKINRERWARYAALSEEMSTRWKERYD